MEGENAIIRPSGFHKILYVSWTIPPVQSGSAFITHQLLRNFKPEEYTAIGGGKSTCISLKNYEGVSYHYCFTELNVKGHGDRFFLPFRLLLFPFFLSKVYRIAKREKVKVVLATFPDAYYMACAWVVSRLLHLPFYAYFHNTYVENRTGISRWIGHIFQKHFFKSAIRIFTMSEGMRLVYSEKYPEWKSKFCVLPHSFSQYPVSTEQMDSKPFGGKYKLVLIGTLNESNMDASKRIIHLISDHSDLYQLDIYSSSNKQLLKFKYDLDLDKPGIQYYDAVPQEQVDHILQAYDACILTHGFKGAYSDVEYQTIFPTRTIPLLLSGKPILAHTPPGAFLTDFLAKHDCAELVSSQSEQDLLEALRRITVDLKRIAQLRSNQKKAAEYFYGPAICKQFKSMVELDLSNLMKS